MSNHHLGTLLALLGASYEMTAFRGEYQAQVIANAKAADWDLTPEEKAEVDELLKDAR